MSRNRSTLRIPPKRRKRREGRDETFNRVFNKSFKSYYTDKSGWKSWPALDNLMSIVIIYELFVAIEFPNSQ